MRLPIKVSSATSNFMIGVTAAASAGAYFMRGGIAIFILLPSLRVLLMLFLFVRESDDRLAATAGLVLAIRHYCWSSCDVRHSW